LKPSRRPEPKGFSDRMSIRLHQRLHRFLTNQDKRGQSLSSLEGTRVRRRLAKRSPQVLVLTNESTRRQFLSAGVKEWALQDLNL